MYSLSLVGVGFGGHPLKDYWLPPNSAATNRAWIEVFVFDGCKTRFLASATVPCLGPPLFDTFLRPSHGIEWRDDEITQLLW